jgi:hypothetical protein
MAMSNSVCDPALGCGVGRPRRATRHFGARMTAFALAAAAVLLMLYGELWLLERSTVAADELTMAACLIDAVDPDRIPTSVCMSSGADDAGKETL